MKLSLILSICFVAGARASSFLDAFTLYNCDEDDECVGKGTKLGCKSYINDGEPKCLQGYCTCPKWFSKYDMSREKDDGVNKFYRCEKTKECRKKKKMYCSPHRPICFKGRCQCPTVLPHWKYWQSETDSESENSKEVNIVDRFHECDEDDECSGYGKKLKCAKFINKGKAQCLGGYCTCPNLWPSADRSREKETPGVNKMYRCKTNEECAKKKRMYCSPNTAECYMGHCRCPLGLPDWTQKKKKDKIDSDADSDADSD